MNEREVDDAVEFLRKHSAMSEHEAVYRMVRTIVIGVVILASILFVCIAGCLTLEKKYAFENGYEEGAIAGSSGSHWVKKEAEPLKPLKLEVK